MQEPILDYFITPHAAFEIAYRQLSESTIRQVLAAPDQREAVRPGRDVLQSLIQFQGVTYLVRIFVDVDRHPPEVVTAYRTSKIDKYWRSES